MKTILLMRHAKSSWDHPGLADHERPLNDRGRGDAPRMGAWLAAQDRVPDVILSSSSQRTRETVAGLLEGMPFEGQPVFHRELYHSDPDTYLEFLRRLPEETRLPMIVAHNPGMDEALEVFCGLREHMSTAAVAVIRFPVESWVELDDSIEGECLHFWKPKDIEP